MKSRLEQKPTIIESLQSAFSAALLKAYRRPLLFLLVILVAPLLSTLFVTHQTSTGLARRQAQLNCRTAAKVAAEAIGATLDRAVLFSQMVSAQPSFLDAVARPDSPAIKKDIERALPALPDADLVIVTNAEGKVIASAGLSVLVSGEDFSHQEAFLGVMAAGGQPYVSSIQVRDAQSFEKTVHVSVPINRSGQLLGVLIVEYRIESIRLWVQQVRVEPEGFIYAVDQQSQLVVYPFQLLSGKPKSVKSWPPVAEPVGPQGFSMDYLDPQVGRRWLAGVYPIGGTGWRVVAVQPDGAVLHLVYQVFLPLGCLVIVLLAIVLFVSVRWAALQALNFRLLQQNAKLLKQSQQRWTLQQGKESKGREGGVSV